MTWGFQKRFYVHSTHLVVYVTTQNQARVKQLFILSMNTAGQEFGQGTLGTVWPCSVVPGPELENLKAQGWII